MTVIIWNARGVGNIAKMDALKLLVSQNKPWCLAILEPKILGDRLAKIARQLGFGHFLHGNPVNTHIWVMWSTGFDMSLISCSRQQITVRVTSAGDSCGLFSFVYASCDRVERQPLWTELTQLSIQYDEPWLVGGDFNIIAHPSEKLGGNCKYPNPDRQNPSES